MGHDRWVAFLNGCEGRFVTEEKTDYERLGKSALAWTRFSSYDICVASEEQIQQWADEAEAGYDVDHLTRRGRGRPGRGAEPMQVVAVRLTAEELDALDEAAAKKQLSRSEMIRIALARLSA